jgi:hypothetical protein
MLNPVTQQPRLEAVLQLGRAAAEMRVLKSKEEVTPWKSDDHMVMKVV